MDRFGWHLVVASHHVPDMSPMMRLLWQRPLPSNGALYIQQLWASGSRTREPILLKFGIQQQIRTTMTVTWSCIIIFLTFKMADGCHVGKYCKWHTIYSLTNGPTGMQLGWSHPIMFSTCPPCCGSHDKGRCLATAHSTFCSYGRLEAKRVYQMWWNLVRNSKLGPQWQSC